MSERIMRADKKITHRLVNRRYRSGQFVIDWLPRRLYTRFDLFHGRDAKHGDWAVTCTIGRLEIGWHGAGTR